MAAGVFRLLVGGVGLPAIAGAVAMSRAMLVSDKNLVPCFGKELLTLALSSVNFCFILLLGLFALP